MRATVSLLLLAVLTCVVAVRYEANWPSIDSRPLPAWYDEAKLGIFIHWGVFSVPSYSPDSLAEWFWWWWKGAKLKPYSDFMARDYKPNFTYADFAPSLTAEFYDPNEWADIFQHSGAEYVVFTSKHHEGYTNWPSNYSYSWNSVAVGPHRDMVGELATAIKTRTTLRFGLYHSLFEWFHPLYLKDKAGNFSTTTFVDTKTTPEMYEIINTYKPEVLWSDGDWEAPSTYWKSVDFLAWLYNDSPVKDTIVTNDRWGIDANCHHGGFLTCMDRYQPGVLQKRKWENAMTIDGKSWGYRRNANLKDYLSIHTLIATFVETVSTGGNMLMNVGPTKEGVINPLYEERLRQFGDWMGVNSEGIKGTRPWTTQNDTLTPNVWYTMKMSTVYAVVLDYPKGPLLSLDAPMTKAGATVEMLGYPGTFTWTARPGKGIDITIPAIPADKLPCQWAWTFKFSGLAN
ncbi:alpha-L-fucosidase [Patella vulgata]|uniref:alpha-L-fucosidase n=1 Tax=Patella vulgata TaxID=6465 RepID=UPI0024A91428|nr:alpha-L-fucosidase [Patella vulgata]